MGVCSSKEKEETDTPPKDSDQPKARPQKQPTATTTATTTTTTPTTATTTATATPTTTTAANSNGKATDGQAASHKEEQKLKPKAPADGIGEIESVDMEGIGIAFETNGDDAKQGGGGTVLFEVPGSPSSLALLLLIRAEKLQVDIKPISTDVFKRVKQRDPSVQDLQFLELQSLLEVDGKLLSGTNVILRQLCAGREVVSAYPSSQKNRARVDELLDWRENSLEPVLLKACSPFLELMSWMLTSDGCESMPGGEVATALANAAELRQQLQQVMDKGEAFLQEDAYMGGFKQPSLADFSMLPLLDVIEQCGDMHLSIKWKDYKTWMSRMLPAYHNKVAPPMLKLLQRLAARRNKLVDQHMAQAAQAEAKRAAEEKKKKEEAAAAEPPKTTLIPEKKPDPPKEEKYKINPNAVNTFDLEKSMKALSQKVKEETADAIKAGCLDEDFSADDFCEAYREEWTKYDLSNGGNVTRHELEMRMWCEDQGEEDVSTMPSVLSSDLLTQVDEVLQAYQDSLPEEAVEPFMIQKQRGKDGWVFDFWFYAAAMLQRDHGVEAELHRPDEVWAQPWDR